MGKYLLRCQRNSLCNFSRYFSVKKITMCTCSTDLSTLSLKSSGQSSLTMPQERSENFLSKIFLLSPRIPRARLKKWRNRSVSTISILFFIYMYTVKLYSNHTMKILFKEVSLLHLNISLRMYSKFEKIYFHLQ